MIGVAASATDLAVAEELFELFKTPWEPAAPGRRYRVALVAGTADAPDADVVLLFGSSELPFDSAQRIEVLRTTTAVAAMEQSTLPLYCGAATFGAEASSLLTIDRQAGEYRRQSAGRTVWRIGYDLFAEIRHLLTQGQPIEQALNPTLDLHIDLLRTLLDRSGVSYVEIPARPQDRDFICCLTHDVDFFGIRRHGLDLTMAGFVMRASIGSVVDFVRGRRSFGDVARNWAALASLPLVFLGLKRDFWQPFEDYARAERGLPSTFFLVPFKGHAGVGPNGVIDRTRAVPYQASEVAEQARQATGAGAELGLHGLDAWRDADAGRREMREVTAISGAAATGIRMHWLYNAADSPRHLEAAGFEYDSTCGYNETIGYRAGTAQAFRLPETELIELPLIIMDSALLAHDRLQLAPRQSMALCAKVIANARRRGGAIVVNWHCRSLAPERLWDRFYQDLLDAIGAGGSVWFATAGQAVAWFKWRRAIRFRVAGTDGDAIEVLAPAAAGPAATLCVHVSGARPEERQDYSIDGKNAVTVRLPHSMRHYV